MTKESKTVIPGVDSVNGNNDFTNDVVDYGIIVSDDDDNNI